MVSAGSSCPAGWTFFQRPSKGVCLKFFLPGGCNGRCNNAYVESKCQEVGGVLAGLQNLDEANWFISEHRRFSDGRASWVWIGAKRVPNTNNYAWTDPYVDGNGYLKWRNSKGPDRGPEANYNCAMLNAKGMLTMETPCNEWYPTFVCVKPSN